MNPFDVTTALAALKSIADVLSKSSEMKKLVEIDEARVEFNNKIIAVQQALNQLQSINLDQTREIDDLKRRQANHENWELDLAKYEVFSPSFGQFAYRLKQTPSTLVQAPLFCPTCMHNRKIMMMQFTQRLIDKIEYQCPACKSYIYLAKGI